MDDKHYPRWVRRTAVSKRGLKGSLVVVEAALGRGPRETRRSPKASVVALGTHDGLDPNNRRGSRGTIPAVIQLAKKSAFVSRVVCTFASKPSRLKHQLSSLKPH